MARIGNEARLLLKLVEERMEKLKEDRLEHTPTIPLLPYRQGYERAYQDYQLTIEETIREIEAR